MRLLDHIKVSAESSGRVLRMHADVGFQVDADQLLAELESAHAVADRINRLYETKLLPERELERAVLE